MTLFDLVELWKKDGLREDLGDKWFFHNHGEGFEIHYNDLLGGLSFIVMQRSPWGSADGDIVTVKRIYNKRSEVILRETLSRNKDIELKELHEGVSQRLKYVYGY